MSAGAEAAMVRAPPTSLGVGERFDLALRANPTTGYSWSLEIPPALVLLEESYARGSALVGAGGVTTFRLAGARAGTARLVARYRRPWESETVRPLSWTIEVVASGSADLGSPGFGGAP